MRQRKNKKELMQDEAKTRKTLHSKELLQDEKEISTFHQSSNHNTHTTTINYFLDGCVGSQQCPK
jgi:hypothetical protein